MMSISQSLGKFSLFIAWLIALVATLVTLYASEIQLLPVCHLCWYQRICIFPLVILLGIAVYRDDRRIGIYTIPLVCVGAFFALYQYLLQLFPGFGPIEFCTMGADCSHIHLKLLGFITYPLLSLIGCIAIIFFLTLAMISQRN